ERGCGGGGGGGVGAGAGGGGRGAGQRAGTTARAPRSAAITATSGGGRCGSRILRAAPLPLRLLGGPQCIGASYRHRRCLDRTDRHNSRRGIAVRPCCATHIWLRVAQYLEKPYHSQHIVKSCEVCGYSA